MRVTVEWRSGRCVTGEVGVNQMPKYEGSGPVDLKDPVALRNLGRAVMTLLRKWNVSEQQQCALLGLSARDGSESLEHQLGQWLSAGRPELLERVAYLLGIHGSLRHLFPDNERLRYSWVRRCNQALGGSAPIDVMAGDNENGIARVWALLNQQLMQ